MQSAIDALQSILDPPRDLGKPRNGGSGEGGVESGNTRHQSQHGMYFTTHALILSLSVHSTHIHHNHFSTST
jgi:hypothetical protein